MARKRAITPAALESAQTQFVSAWGQMGSTWGISRTMAEIHALLYITGSPLNTDQIMERLSISRGNASMSLRALLEWGIVARVHKRGDRKEYFEAEQDAWSMLRQVIRERLRREVHPVLASLFEIRDATRPEGARAAGGGGSGGASGGGTNPLNLAIVEHNRRLDTLLELVQTIDRLGERFVGSDGRGLRVAATALSKVT